MGGEWGGGEWREDCGVGAECAIGLGEGRADEWRERKKI